MMRQLRLNYSPDGMVTLITLLDQMKLGLLPEPVALFLVHASNAANWHEMEEEA